MSVLKVMPDLLTPTFVPDLGDTLNWNGGRVTSCTLDYFTTKGIVNPWSWRKAMSVANRQGNVTNDELPSFNYGLQIAQTTGTPIALYNLVKQAPYYGRGFHHKLPQGGQADPYRISDFCGYWPNAIAPLKVYIPSRFAYITEVSALENEQFNLAFNPSLYEMLGADDGIIGANYNIWVDSLYPQSPSVGFTWRTGLLLKSDDTEVVIFSTLRLKTGSDNLISLFAGKSVEVLPFMANMPTSTIPDDTLSVGITASQWSNVKCYAYPDGIFKVKFNPSSDNTDQDTYSKVRVAELSAEFHDRTRTSVFIRCMVLGFDPNYRRDIENLYVGVFNADGERVAYHAVGNVSLSYLEHRHFKVVLDGNFGENYTVRVYWDGLEQREIPIRLNVG